MKYLVVLFASIAFACGAQEGGLRVRFSVNILGFNDSAFFDIPRTVSGVTELGWTQQPRADDYLPSLQLYCPADLTFCAMYDDTDYMAGVQVALDQQKFTESVFDFDIRGFTQWQADNGRTYWTIQQYFVDEAFLATDPNERINSRDATKTLQLDGVWVRGINKELLKIPNTEEGIINRAFTKQTCIPFMGDHYYYNMTESTECTSEGMMPWFSLVNDGELIGTGLINFGKLTLEEGERDWFETSSKLAVQVIVPNGPDCMYDLADDPGRVTMHIYYIDDPRTLLCVF